MKLHQSLFAASMCLSLTAVIGCGSTSDAVDDGKAVESVEITPDKDTLSKGSTFQFHVVVNYADGTTKDVSTGPGTVWNTSDADIATVSEDGMVTAVKEGVVDISASYQADNKTEKADEHFAVTP